MSIRLTCEGSLVRSQYCPSGVGCEDTPPQETIRSITGGIGSVLDGLGSDWSRRTGVARAASMDVGSFVGPPGYRYWFLLVRPTPYRGNPIEQRLAQNIEDFGADLGSHGIVISAPDSSARQSLEELAGLEWPEGVGDAIRESLDPFLLVLARDPQGSPPFAPMFDPWAMVWLADYEPDDLWRVFADLARRVNADADVLGYLKQVQRDATLTTASNRVQRALDAVDVKPSFFGVSVDVVALVKALAGRD